MTSRKDIADFYLFLQEEDPIDGKTPAPLFEKLIAYTERRYTISVNEVKQFLHEMGKPKTWPGGNYKLCIVALDSLGTPGELPSSQCQQVPSSSVRQFLRSAAKRISSLSFLSIAIFISFFRFL